MLAWNNKIRKGKPEKPDNFLIFIFPADEFQFVSIICFSSSSWFASPLVCEPDLQWMRRRAAASSSRFLQHKHNAFCCCCCWLLLLVPPLLSYHHHPGEEKIECFCKCMHASTVWLHTIFFPQYQSIFIFCFASPFCHYTLIYTCDDFLPHLHVSYY